MVRSSKILVYVSDATINRFDRAWKNGGQKSRSTAIKKLMEAYVARQNTYGAAAMLDEKPESKRGKD